MSKIQIYTDGSCIGNPGPGGWGVIILKNNEKVKLSGSDKATTNNRMEMMAIIKALEWLHKEIPLADLTATEITLYSDSNLLIKTLTQGWKRKANTDLWAKIDKLLVVQDGLPPAGTLSGPVIGDEKSPATKGSPCGRKNPTPLNITWTWVKAHANNKYNNLVDELAFKAAKDQ